MIKSECLRLNKKMKLYLSLLVLTLVLVGCDNKPNEIKNMKDTGQSMGVVEIDGCEYLSYYAGNIFARNFTHKGNCKYCIERNKK